VVCEVRERERERDQSRDYKIQRLPGGRHNHRFYTMKFPRNITKWRAMHAEANAQLWAARNRFFGDSLREIESRIRFGGRQALRKIALELRDRGVYSAKTAPSVIELAIIKRIYASVSNQVKWEAYVRGLVGSTFFMPYYEARRAA